MQEETVQPQEPADTGKPVEQQLAEALAAAEQHKEAMLRALADADNARKRSHSEIAAARKYALERFAEELLPVMDSLQAALKSGDSSGIELTARQLEAAFSKSSIRAIEPVAGEKFDPHRHQAMAAVEAKADPNTVVAVMQKGYSLHERVLRPALVTVAKAVEKSGSNPISDA